MIFAQDISDPVTEAKKFVDNSKEIESVNAALAGARDTMADWINEDVSTRSKLRNLFRTQGILRSKEAGDKTEGTK